MAAVVLPLHRAIAEPNEYLIGYYGVGTAGSLVSHKIGLIRPDGTGEHFPAFDIPNQHSWVFGPQFADGRRILFGSSEEQDIAKVRAGKAVTRDWVYDLHSGALEPACEKDRQADQIRPYALIAKDTRVIATAYIGNEERIFVKDLDGANAVELTHENGGFHYALELSHDKSRIACHVTGGKPDFYNPGMYSINVFDLESGKRTFVAGQPEHLMFGPHWSPDDKRLVYLDCLAVQDPAHFRAALAVGKADGSEHRAITPGQTHWFGTPYGSNMSEWSPDGQTVTYTRLSENAMKDMSAGGSQLCLLNPDTGAITELTPAEEGTWDYRAAWAPDGSAIAFARVKNGGVRELWLMNPDGSNPRRLTDGYEHRGADHFRWLKVAHRD